MSLFLWSKTSVSSRFKFIIAMLRHWNFFHKLETLEGKGGEILSLILWIEYYNNTSKLFYYL